MKNNKGITLIALIVTIIILIILAGVSVRLILGQNGIIERAKRSSMSNEEGSAREKLELALMDLRIDKETKNEYNENEYIDNYLSSKQMVVNENIVLVDGWQFEIDRNKLKIIMNLGQGEESDDIYLVANVIDAADFTKATLKIEITYEGEIDSIQINGQNETIPTKQDGKYVLEKEILENENFTIYVKDKDNNYKVEKVNVESISEDTNISSKEEINEFRNRVNAGATYEGKVITLTSSIDLEGSEENEWIPIGNAQKPFKGTFDGQNNTINNVYINEDTGNQALFGCNKGIIKNVTVKGEITGNGYYIAGICATNSGNIENCINYIKVTNKSTQYNQSGGIVARIEGNNSTIKNCTNYGEVNSKCNHVGGIVGHSASEGFVIDLCNNYGKVTGTGNTGGIIGAANVSGTIKNCVNDKEVTSSSKGCVGGILGLYSNATTEIEVKNCKNKGKIYAETSAVGGILGNSETKANIEKCINEGEISAGNGNCGGIVGNIGKDDVQIYTSNINQCANKGYIHATGNSGGPSCGGIIGLVQAGDSVIISHSYNTKEINATSYTSGYVSHGVGGIVGSVYNNATATTTKSKATISNSYNIGDIKNSYSSSYAGQIIGRDQNSNASVTNCYYLSTAKGTNTYGGTSTQSATLKTYATKLGSSIWTTDEKIENLGYPIFEWE